MNIFQASTSQDLEEVRKLFEEYAQSLDFNLCFQNFNDELAGLPGKYALPDGRLLLAGSNNQFAGCIALRKIDADTCEMKRLFVRPQFRGERLGTILIDRLIDEAREIGYRKMCLDTVPGKMDKAIALYLAKGFIEIDPYYDSPVSGTKFLQLNL